MRLASATAQTDINASPDRMSNANVNQD